MISAKSLSEQFLPNIYVKSLSLESNYQVKTQTKTKSTGYGSEQVSENVLALGDTASSKITLSTKFLKNSNFMTELALLLDSEVAQYFKIFAHQITDKQTYQNLIKTATKEVLASDNSSLQFINTTVLTYFDVTDLPTNIVQIAMQETPAADPGQAVARSLKKAKDSFQSLTEQVLPDGTILNEKVSEVSFDFEKDTDFLAYIFVVGVQHEDIDEVYISKPLKEIIILDGEFQNRGLVFTIAPYNITQPETTDMVNEVEQQNTFGKPGDIWAGPVHKHQGRFMVGAQHSVKTFQPFLDYSIVPITKYVDNRVQEKIERNILNITKTFETLHSLTSRYQNAPNVLDFAENKKTTYVSEMYLSQDRKRRVFGSFVVDKTQIMKKETAFPSILGNAKQVLSKSGYQEFEEYLTSRLKLNSLKLFVDNKELGSIDGDNEETFSWYKFKQDGTPYEKLSNIKLVLQRNSFEARNPSGDNTGLEYFSFKHNIKSPSNNEKMYHVEVEYIDPTVNAIKTLKRDITTAINQVNLLINYVNSNPVQKANETKRSGFDQVTEKISETLIPNIKKQSGVKVEENGLLTSIRELIEAQNRLFLIYFYSPDVLFTAVVGFFISLSNINTTTLSQLLVLEQFLQHLNNKIGSDLDSFGSRPIKSTRPLPQGTVNSKGNVESVRSNRKIMFKSGKSKIKTYDYGYDFTGFIDSPKEEDLFEGRDKERFLKIMSNDYQNACLLAFSEIKRGSLSLQEAVGAQFKPYGLLTRTVSDLLYSYLNIPINNVTDSVVLPVTIVNQTAPAFNALNILTSISKIKKYISENNFASIDGPSTAGIVLKEDLISILAQDGVDLPSVGQTELERTKIGLFTAGAAQPAAAFNQNNIFAKSTAKLINPFVSVNPQLSVVDQKFQLAPQFTKQTNLKNNNDTSKNNLMNSLYARKNFSKVKNKSFKLTTSKPGFKPYEGSGILEKAGLKPPLQVLCLSVGSNSPFKDYLSGKNKFYISNGVVNPAALAYFWFKHQNVVKVEFLSGYHQAFNTARLKNKENPYEAGQTLTTFERNVKKPIWRMLNGSTIASLTSGTKILCRLVRYEHGSYINKTLTKEFDIPIINDHFILEKSETSFVVPEPPGVELAAGQVLDQISDILQDAKGIPGIPDVDALIQKTKTSDMASALKTLSDLAGDESITTPPLEGELPPESPALDQSKATQASMSGGMTKLIAQPRAKTTAKITTAISDFFNTSPGKTR